MSYYIPQVDDIHEDIDALEEEHLLDFNDQVYTEAYRFSDTLTLNHADEA